MKMKIDPRHVSIGRLFSKNNVFRIPKYQRDYAWTDEQITDFIEDLRRCYSSRRLDKPRDHFFGGIVSIEEKIPGSDTYRFYLVDGQQRMATFTLFIASIVSIYKSLLDEAKAISDKPLEKIIDKRINDLTDKYLKYEVEKNTVIETVDRLEVSKADRLYFRDIVNGHPRTKSRQSHYRLEHTYNKLHDFILDEIIRPLPTLQDKLTFLKRFEEILNDDFSVIHMATGSEKEAYRLFQVLNDRGTGLTVGDLLRAKTMQLLESDTYKDQQKKIMDAWDHILADPHEMTENFFQWYYASNEGKRPSRATLLDDFMDAFFPQHKKSDETVQSSQQADAVVETIWKMKEELELCRKLLEGQWPYEHKQPITQWDRNRLQLLMVELKHTNCLPLLLAAGRHLDHKNFSEIIQIIELFIFRYRYISNEHISPVTKKYLKESVSIRSATNIKPYSVTSLRQELRELLTNSATDPVFTSNLREKLIYKNRGSNKILKYFLITLEHYARWHNQGKGKLPKCLDKTRTYDFANSTIEHIYPQNPKVHKPLLDEKVDTLGNLTFLGAQDNQVADNEDFPIKRPVFKQSSVSINHEIAREPDWDLAAINRHETRLIDMAVKIFTV